MNPVRNIAIIPTSDFYDNDRLFDVTLNIDDRLLPSIFLKDYFNKKRVNVHTIDYYNDYSEIDVVIFERIDYEFINCFISKYSNKILILIPWEPEVVSSRHSVKSLINLSRWFDFVLTWNDSLVDNVQFYKLNYPHNLEYELNDENSKSFDSRKLLTQISSNLYSKNSLELYSLRKQFNLIMNELIPDEFDFYGKGWSNNLSYKGIVENKLDTLSNYKFSLCFENMKNGQGYITEKIFDCFSAGVVPIYYGADNIADYIPGNCYIDYRNFHDPHLLLEFIQNMDYMTWQEYLLNAKLYLESEKSEEFSINTYIRVISEVIRKDKVVLNVSFIDRKLLYLKAYQAKLIKKLKKIHFLKKIKNSLRVK